MNRGIVPIKLTMRKLSLTQIGDTMTFMSLDNSIGWVPVQVVENIWKDVILADIFNLDTSYPNSEFAEKRMSGSIQSSYFIIAQVVDDDIKIKTCSVRIQKSVWFYFPSDGFPWDPGVLSIHRGKRYLLNRIRKTLRFGCPIFQGVGDFSCCSATGCSHYRIEKIFIFLKNFINFIIFFGRYKNTLKYIGMIQIINLFWARLIQR